MRKENNGHMSRKLAKSTEKLKKMFKNWYYLPYNVIFYAFLQHIIGF